MHEYNENERTTLIDRAARAGDAENLAHTIGLAIHRNDKQAAMYILGRVDEKLQGALYSKRDVYERLRDVLCAYLDFWPDPMPTPADSELAIADE